MGGGSRISEVANYVPNAFRDLCSSDTERRNRALEKDLCRLLQVAAIIKGVMLLHLFLLNPTPPLLLKTAFHGVALYDLIQIAENRFKMLNEALTEATIAIKDFFNNSSLRDHLLKNTLIMGPLMRVVYQIID